MEAARPRASAPACTLAFGPTPVPVEQASLRRDAYVGYRRASDVGVRTIANPLDEMVSSRVSTIESQKSLKAGVMPDRSMTIMERTLSTGNIGERQNTRRRSSFSLYPRASLSRTRSTSMVSGETGPNDFKSTMFSGPVGAHLIERNTNEEVLAIMRGDIANKFCADCSTPLGSDAWSAVNHGIFICIRCCGVHRSLGTHISQCRSVDLDDWTEDHVAQLRGNRASKAVLEAYLPLGVQLPSSRDPMALLADWIRAKYVRRDFVEPRHSPTLETYELAESQVTASQPTSRSRASTACISDGVLRTETTGWGASQVFVALDPSVESGAKTSQAGTQDRPMDSRSIQVTSGGEPLLEIELRTASEVVVWMKALRGSSALGSRSGLRCGWFWLTANDRIWKRRRMRWVLLHPSGLYQFKTGSVGANLPVVAVLGDIMKGVLVKSSIQSINWGTSQNEFWFSLRTSDGINTQLAVGQESIRDEWLKAVFEWVGWECQLDGTEKLPPKQATE